MVRRRGGEKVKQRREVTNTKPSKQLDKHDDSDACKYLERAMSQLITVHRQQKSKLKDEKDALQEKSRNMRPPCHAQKLYGSYMPEKGLLVSSVVQHGKALFAHDMYTTGKGGSVPLYQQDNSASITDDLKGEKHATQAASITLRTSDVQAAQRFAQSISSRKALLYPARKPKTALDTSLTCIGFHLEKIPQCERIAIVSGSNNKFCEPQLLPDARYLVFDATCSNTMISDSVSAGGAVICHGAGCNVTFSNVHFVDCPLVVISNAIVTLENCSFSYSEDVQTPNEAAYLARLTPYFTVFASGLNTTVTLDGCHIDCCDHVPDVIAITDGATVHLKNTAVSRVRKCAIEVWEAHAQITCDHCTIQGIPGKQPPEDYKIVIPDSGIMLIGGAEAKISDTSIRDLGMGIMMNQQSFASLQSVMISDIWSSGIEVEHSGLRAVKCLLQRYATKVPGHGVTVQDRCNVYLEGCVLRDSTGSGVFVTPGGTLVATQCQCISNKDEGFSVRGGDTKLRVSGCTITGSNIGIEAFCATACTLSGNIVRKCDIGYDIREVCNASVTSCTATDIGEVGFRIDGKGRGRMVHIQDCSMHRGTGKNVTGLMIAGGASVKASGCVFAPGLQFPFAEPVYHFGVRLAKSGTSLTLQDCSMTAGSGVSAESGARLVMSQCKTSKGRYGVFLVECSAQISHWTSASELYGLFVNSASVEVESCEFKEDVFGAHICLAENSPVNFRDCKFAAAPYKPVKDQMSACIFQHGGKGTLSLKGCHMKGSRCGVRISKTDANVKITDCVITGSETAGIFCLGVRTHLKVSDCRIEEHDTWAACFGGCTVVAERVHCSKNYAGAFCSVEGAYMTLIDCSSDRDGVGFSAMGEHPWQFQAFRNPVIKMEKVLVRRSRGTGFGFYGGMQCTLQNCSAMQCGGPGVDVVGLNHEVSVTPGAKPTTARVTLADCMFKKNAGAGVRASLEAEVHVKQALSCQNKGPGFLAALTGTRLKLTQCQAPDNEEAYINDGLAALEVTDCSPDVKPVVLNKKQRVELHRSVKIAATDHMLKREAK